MDISDSLKRITGLIPVAVAVITVWSGPRPAFANHCYALSPCWRIFPDPHPRAAEGYVWECDWPDGWHWRCHSVQIATNKERRAFANCEEASEWVSNNDVADVSPSFRPRLSAVSYTRNLDGTYTAETTLTWQLKKKKTVMRLPAIKWPGMTRADKRAVKKFLDAVLGHEAGHVTVGESVVNDFTGPVRSDASATREGALTNLQEKLNDLRSMAQTELDQVAGNDGDYDTVTDHGRRQSAAPESFPGGPDIILTCPR